MAGEGAGDRRKLAKFRRCHRDLLWCYCRSIETTYAWDFSFKRQHRLEPTLLSIQTAT